MTALPGRAPTPALLVLEDGRTFRGRAFGAEGAAFGEAVFATGMTGYQETLTDPSYHRQIVAMTAPHIGNTGVNDEDDESARIWVAGYVVRDPARRPSNWRARRGLEEQLRAQGVVGLAGVDTRALTRHLRERGAMRAGLFSGEALPPGAALAGGSRASTAAAAEAAPPGELRDAADAGVAPLLERVRASPGMAGADLVGEVTTPRPYVVPAIGPKRFTVAAIDLGIKAMTPRRMAERGIEVHVLPATTGLDAVEAVGADGVFFSNGPGDPAAADAPVALARAVLARGIPLFGICFGNQVLGRALGLGTHKLKYGHRGINTPVMDRTTGRVEVTAHNHGFAVAAPPHEEFDTDFGPARVTHVCLNDGVVEGLALTGAPAFSVQYHPEAAAGPHDAGYLFDRFAELMSGAVTAPTTRSTRAQAH